MCIYLRFITFFSLAFGWSDLIDLIDLISEVCVYCAKYMMPLSNVNAIFLLGSHMSSLSGFRLHYSFSSFQWAVFNRPWKKCASDAISQMINSNLIFLHNPLFQQTAHRWKMYVFIFLIEQLCFPSKVPLLPFTNCLSDASTAYCTVYCTTLGHFCPAGGWQANSELLIDIIQP